MAEHPNILILMTDQMQARVLQDAHPCKVPNLDRLRARGTWLRNAYTTNAICSPARASLMTGLLPHNHGVLTVTHTTDADQCCLRDEHPHFAQRLRAAGYRTGYFGKWHVERSNELHRYGWQTHAVNGSDPWRERAEQLNAGQPEPEWVLRGDIDRPEGYRQALFYGVTSQPAERRGMGVTTSLAGDFLAEQLGGADPWCCFVSFTEPHDPFVCGEDAFAEYDPGAMPLSDSLHDELAGRPYVYRRARQAWANFGQQQHREAAACYFASISEIDQQFGRLIDQVAAAGELDNTLVVVTTDHGEHLGAHGLYCKNFHAGEEVYNIPLIVAGPGVAAGAETAARVGLHDLAATLPDLAGVEPLRTRDARSAAALLAAPPADYGDWSRGYAEYHGGRFWVTQRIAWDGPWKFVFNGFAEDELYNLDADPAEQHNLADDPAHAAVLQRMMTQVWEALRNTGDHSVLNSQYPILRLGAVGPQVLEG